MKNRLSFLENREIKFGRRRKFRLGGDPVLYCNAGCNLRGERKI